MAAIDWDQIDTLLLDMDGTLLDLHFDNYFWLEHLPSAYARHKGITPQAAFDELNKSFVGLKGTLNWYCLDYWSELTGLPIAELKKDLVDRIQYRPHVVDFLTQMREQGKALIIVTNAHRDSLNLKLAHTGLDSLVDRIISSHDYRSPKEEASFWDQLHADLAFDRDTTLLIDDSAAVLESARRWGIQHLLMIYHPDSRRKPAVHPDFPGLHHFDEAPISLTTGKQKSDTDH